MHSAVVTELIFTVLEMIDLVPVSVLKLCRKTTCEICKWGCAILVLRSPVPLVIRQHQSSGCPQIVCKISIFVTCPAPRRHTAKKTESACELVASAAGSNIYTLTIFDPQQFQQPLSIFALAK